MQSLDKLLRPGSVAVVGASDDVDKHGHRLLRNLIAGGYEGRIYPVNPKAETVLGIKSYPTLGAIPERVDLAVIIIPASLVLNAVRDAVDARVGSLVIITAGFGETGDQGRQIQAEISQLCVEANIPMVGPNCMGVCNFPAKLTAVFNDLKSAPGHVSFVSQSGTYGVTTLNYGLKMGITFNTFISSGNEAVTQFSDYLEYLGDDPETHVIMGYIESLRDGEKFARIAKEVTRKKPVVVMKFGRTRKGSVAAASHTGALTGTHEVYSSVFRQCGVIEVTRTHDLLNVAMALSMQPPMRHNRAAIIGASGGFAVAATDYLEEHGVEVPTFNEQLQQHIRREADTKAYASLQNPIDLAADFRSAPLLKCIEIALEQDSIDGAIAALPASPYPPLDLTIRGIERMQTESGKPVLICFYARPEGVDAIRAMTRQIPVYGSPEDVGQAMACLSQYGKYLAREM
jgi:acyl-CoA synthetase (NDP forming)